VLLFVICIISAAVYYILKSKYRSKLIKAIKDLYHSIIWNGLIRFYLQSFLIRTNAVMLIFFATKISQSKKKGSLKKFVPAILESTVIFMIVPILILYVLIKHR